MKRIKKYYRVEFELTSPLSVGSGENTITDSDIVVDGRGLPYIPGSALAGVYRNLFANTTADMYFGYDLTPERLKKSIKEGKNTLTSSDIIVYDAVISNPKNRAITKRDMVSLDEYKVSLKGAKFDFQVLEPGVKFVTYIEQNMVDANEGYVAEEIAYAWIMEQIQLGAKTGRGYGHTKAIALAECSFDLRKVKERDAWLNFDMYEDKGWKTVEVPTCLSAGDESLSEIYQEKQIQLKEKQKLTVELKLKQRGGISIRQYSTNVNEADYMQMVRQDETPFIPGTSWAGAFRAQFEKLEQSFGRNCPFTEVFFGVVKGSKEEESHKTRVTFSESILENGNWKVYSRNAIDRFSNGTIGGALYTEKSYFEGDTKLTITCDMTEIDATQKKYFQAVLAASILDLDRGYLAVGGLTSVGHGLFTVKSVVINGTEMELEEIALEEQYVAIMNAMNA